MTLTAHKLPDVVLPGLKVVFCGTAAGTRSAQVGAYYAGRGNKFWRTLFQVGLTPRPLDPHEFVRDINERPVPLLPGDAHPVRELIG